MAKEPKMCLHTHPQMERDCNVPDGHVIIDKHVFYELLGIHGQESTDQKKGGICCKSIQSIQNPLWGIEQRLRDLEDRLKKLEGGGEDRKALSKTLGTFSTGAVFREPDGTEDMILVAVPHQGAGREGPGDKWMFFADRHYKAVSPAFAVRDQKAVTQAEIDARFGSGKVFPYDKAIEWICSVCGWRCSSEAHICGYH